MDINYTSYKFSDLFDIHEREDKTNPELPFNFAYSAKELNNSEGTGSGIYLIFDKHQENTHRLIYIGMHCTNKPFHKDRVKKHLGSLTFRQEVALAAPVSANNYTNRRELLKHFEDKYGAQNKDSELFKIISKNVELYPWRVGSGKPEGTLALFAPNYHSDEVSRRRFDYACAFWDFFKRDNNINEENFNKRFMFAWIDLNKETHDLVCPDSYKKLLKDIEQRLIWKFHPIINDEMLKAGIMLDKDYSKLFSIGDEFGAIGKKVSEEIKRIINTYKLLKG